VTKELKPGEVRLGGLTAQEWNEVARVVWTWPGMKVCDHDFAQTVIERANGNAFLASKEQHDG
jgi:hypothetical protein